MIPISPCSPPPRTNKTSGSSRRLSTEVTIPELISPEERERVRQLHAEGKRRNAVACVLSQRWSHSDLRKSGYAYVRGGTQLAA